MIQLLAIFLVVRAAQGCCRQCFALSLFQLPRSQTAKRAGSSHFVGSAGLMHSLAQTAHLCTLGFIALDMVLHGWCAERERVHQLPCARDRATRCAQLRVLPDVADRPAAANSTQSADCSLSSSQYNKLRVCKLLRAPHASSSSCCTCRHGRSLRASQSVNRLGVGVGLPTTILLCDQRQTGTQ